MKRLIPIFLLIATGSMTAFAQDSGGDYGARAEVFVTAFGLLPHHADGNGIRQEATKAGGGSAGYRFHLNDWSALEGRYGFSRNSQKYTTGGPVSSIPVYLSEISGSYIYNLPKSRHIQPFLQGGGGVVLFSPANYGGGTTPLGANTPANNVGYSVLASALKSASIADGNPDLPAVDAVPFYGGSSSGPGRQAKGMLVYGAGVDAPVSSHLSIRMEFRALGYKSPDFGAAALRTDAFTFIYEPSVGVAYRF